MPPRCAPTSRTCPGATRRRRWRAARLRRPRPSGGARTPRGGPSPPAPAGAQGIMQERRYWPQPGPDPAPPDRELTMPVLLLAGELDLSTPLPWARQEAAQLPRARLVVVGDAGHSTQLHSAPAAAAAERFLLAPSRRLRGALAGGPRRPQPGA